MMKTNRKKLFKSRKGITLIALVVTIIVLIILAGIALNMLRGDNGILNRAKQAREETIIAGEKEQIAMAWNALMTDKAILKIDDIDSAKFENELKKNGNNVKVEDEDNENGGFSVTFIDTTHEYIVEKNGNITLKGANIISDESSGEIEHITQYNLFSNGILPEGYSWSAFTDGSSSSGFFNHEADGIELDASWRTGYACAYIDKQIDFDKIEKIELRCLTFRK